MTLKSLHLSVLLAGLMAAGFAAAQTPTAVPAAPVTRAEVKAEAKSGMTAKTGEGVDVGAPKRKAKAHHAKARHHMKAKRMKHHHVGSRTSMKTGEGTDLGKK
ncbi:hypothetical protein BH11PSE7_BH11PSE7_14190 [soil metagenome]